MKRLLFALIALPAFAAEPSYVTLVVPVVASTAGANDTRWKTYVELRNDYKTELTVALELPTAPNDPIIMQTLPPGGVQRFDDIVGEAFGLDNVLSPLVVQTLGHKSVRVSASAYAIHETTVTRPQPIPITDASSFYPLRTLPALSYSDAMRTNVGLVNLGEQNAVITVALRSQTGDMVGASRIELLPNTMRHDALQILFPSMKNGDNYTVLVETVAKDTYVYASVIDNTTNEARFIVPVVGSR